MNNIEEIEIMIAGTVQLEYMLSISTLNIKNARAGKHATFMLIKNDIKYTAFALQYLSLGFRSETQV